MTKVQESIREYIYKNFHPESVLLFPKGEDQIRIIDKTGASMTLTMNLFGDIMDADTKKIYAISDLPHDVNKIENQLPHSWKEVDRK